MQFFIIITLILALVNTASGAELRGAGAKETLDFKETFVGSFDKDGFDYGAETTYYCPDDHWHVTCASGSNGCYAGNIDLCTDLTKVRNVRNFEVCVLLCSEKNVLLISRDFPCFCSFP
jgi:hypothetical protein